jgi:hypothetical protein
MFSGLVSLFIAAASVGLASSASAQTEVFDSTNLPAFSGSSVAVIGPAAWYAFRFDAAQAMDVDRIEVFFQSDAGYSDFFVQIATDYNTRSIGSFASTG